jgi:hypothetical protein
MSTTGAGGSATLPGEVIGGIFDVGDLVVVVTGAASGLGFTMAEVLAECGARVNAGPS